jgi:hypothetical protein
MINFLVEENGQLAINFDALEELGVTAAIRLEMDSINKAGIKVTDAILFDGALRYFIMYYDVVSVRYVSVFWLRDGVFEYGGAYPVDYAVERLGVTL